MTSGSRLRLLNVLLRGFTLGSKFVLIFFLARVLAPEALGLYGLLVVTVGYALYLLGLDFYTFTTRELLASDRSRWGQMLKSQAALSAALYLVFLPLLLAIFFGGLLPWQLLGWFFCLLVLEHLNQEVGRLLVALSEPLSASVVLFFRSGLWGLIVIAVMALMPEARQLWVVLLAWVSGGAVALLVGVQKLHRVQMSGWRDSVDWRWIAVGLKIAVPLLLATLALRGLTTLDRYWFKALAGPEVLGAYVLFATLCNALIAFLDAGVFAFIYPQMVSAHARQDNDGFRSSFGKLAVQTVAVSLVFALLAGIFIGPMLEWLGKPLYQENLSLFPWVLGGIVLYALGMIPHYGLYARGRDRAIVHSHFGAMAVFVLATGLLSIVWGAYAVPMGLCCAFLFILCWKTWFFYSQAPANHSLKP